MNSSSSSKVGWQAVQHSGTNREELHRESGIFWRKHMEISYWEFPSKSYICIYIYIWYRCIRVPPNGYEEFISTISNMNRWIWFFQPDASGHTLADSPLILRSIRTCLVDHGCAWSTSSSDVVSFYVSCFEVLYFLLSTFFAGSIHPTAGLDKRVRCCPVWSYGDEVWK